MKWIIGLAIIVLIGGGLLWWEKDNKNPSPAQEKTVLMKTVNATIHTAKGDIMLELYPEAAPRTVENFVTLSKKGFYRDTKFHRVIPEFMIQGGDPLSKTDDPRVGSGGPGFAFADEINPKALGLPDTLVAQYEARGYQYRDDLESLPVTVGAIAMANAGPNTNGSQFFIVTQQDQPHLNGLHTVFGKVIEGMDEVRSIRQGDVIESVEIEEK
jgi:peptidyl-prolyl cis-trans isomerase B (cyclophilin B)